MRYPAEMLLELLASGMRPDEILGDYPDLDVLTMDVDCRAGGTRAPALVPANRGGRHDKGE
ncbi:DUF433 domain-containing protein [Nocardia africana]|uniref:DUF433 domain-containing protein n=1 Tax=Nocardia africana TaxID=134964 RepID=A0ABW6NQL1_9NOCA